MGLRFGVLGTGYWAQEAHAAALAASGQADLVGIWGRDPAKTDAAARRFGVTAYGDLVRLLAEVDAVAIAVPPDVQAELAATCCSTSRWPCPWRRPTGSSRRWATPRSPP
jgi:predicted dehydrogenase